MKQKAFLLLMALTVTIFANETQKLLKPVEGYGWVEKIIQSGDIPVHLYIKDTGYKKIVVYKNTDFVDINKKQHLVDFWAGFRNHVNVTEFFKEGKEKFLGKDSYFFDFKSEVKGAENYTTVNIVNIKNKQYLIQRISTIVDPKVDKEMVTVLETINR